MASQHDITQFALLFKYQPVQLRFSGLSGFNFSRADGQGDLLQSATRDAGIVTIRHAAMKVAAWVLGWARLLQKAIMAL